MNELAKPGRDPRKQFEIFKFQEGVNEMKDLQVGMKLPGVVTNVTAFGAFIDIGVHQDGLAHVSQLSDSFIRDAAEAVKVGQRVMATVMEVDIQRKRIALSLKSKPDFERKQGGGGGGLAQQVRAVAKAVLEASAGPAAIARVEVALTTTPSVISAVAAAPAAVMIGSARPPKANADAPRRLTR